MSEEDWMKRYRRHKVMSDLFFIILAFILAGTLAFLYHTI